MQRIFWFLYTYRAFISFVLLEVFCGWLIVQNNTYQGASFYNSSNRYTAQVLQQTQEVKDYFSLKRVNKELAAENARLHQLYQKAVQQSASIRTRDIYKPDSTLSGRYQFIAAKVIKNSTTESRNYITIDKGTADGIRKEMGVISAQGVVGKVTDCSEHFSVITSVLHIDYKLSSQIKRNDAIGMVVWPGGNSRKAQMKFVPRYLEVKVSDTVTTSGFNSVFPAGVRVGIVRKITAAPAENTYDLDIDLLTDFNRLTYVYVVDNIFKSEQEQVEQKAINRTTHAQ